MLEQVRFYTSGDWSRTQRFDRSQLQLGRVLYLDESVEPADKSVSTMPTPGSQAVGVAWISPSDWSVLLERPRTPDPRTIESVCALLPAFGRSQVEAALTVAAADASLNRQYMTAEYRASRLHAVEAVLERLDLVERLSADDVGRRVFHHWEPLVVYLLLTCFDLLGQPVNWMPFGSWLTSKRVTAERDAASEGASGSPTEQAIQLHEAYTEKYGVKSAFQRFMREVLDPGERQALLDSLVFHRNSNPPDLASLDGPDDAGKERYLYGIRNSYTHRAQFSPGVHDAVLPGGLMDVAQVNREQWVDATTWTSVNTVVAWPAVLRRTVVAGLARYLRRLLVEADNRVMVAELRLATEQKRRSASRTTVTE